MPVSPQFGAKLHKFFLPHFIGYSKKDDQTKNSNKNQLGKRDRRKNHNGDQGSEMQFFF